MIHRIPITKARVNLGSVVRRVHVNKEYFILEKDGIPVAGVMDANELEDYLELRDPQIKADIKKSQREYLEGKGRPLAEFLAEIASERKAKQRHRKR
jgi:hypothetical protein